MPKKVLSKPVGTVHRVESKWTFSDYVIGAVIVFVLIAVFSG